MVEGILATQESSDELFESLIEKHYNQIVKLALMYVKDKDMAEDIAQDVFLKVYKNLKKFKRRSGYYTWIYRIAVNQCKDYLKSAGYQRTVPLMETPIMDAKDPLDIAMNHWEHAWLLECIDRLSPMLKQVIILYYYNDMTTVEISAITKAKESTVRTRLTRARGLLKDMLHERRLQNG